MAERQGSASGEPMVETSPKNWDEIKTTTCYMCACRCGIKVYLKDGTVTYIEGNRDHPVNKGVLCGKGSAGIMQQYSPARLSKPCCASASAAAASSRKSNGTRRWLATEWLAEPRKTDPRKLAFFTGRDQSQGLTGWWAQRYGTPNYAAHGGFCSVNMAAAGLYTIGGSFWEFGEPDWDLTEYFLHVRGCRGPRLQPDQNGLEQAQETRRQIRLDQSGADRLLGDRR